MVGGAAKLGTRAGRASFRAFVAAVYGFLLLPLVIVVLASFNAGELLAGLLRQSVFGRLAGYEDVNDAERLCRDPAMRWVVGDRAITGFAASASQMGRFETKWLCRRENLAALADLPGHWIDKVQKRRPPKIIV